jgi:hypothetical protein
MPCPAKTAATRPHPSRARTSCCHASRCGQNWRTSTTPSLAVRSPVASKRGRNPRTKPAEQITSGLAARNWPPDATRLPWVASAYPRWHRTVLGRSSHTGNTRKEVSASGHVLLGAASGRAIRNIDRCGGHLLHSGSLRRSHQPAQAPEPDDEIQAFKAELQQALADPGQLPTDELFDAVDYGDGSDEAFLRRLWHDLYHQPDTPAAGADPHRAMDTAYDEDLAGRLYGLVIGLDDQLDREDARLLQHFIEVGEYGLAPEEIAGTLAHAKVPITDQERSDMLALIANDEHG